MYQEHPEFTLPSDPEAKLWRYLDLTKFMSLLERCELYFSPAENFADQFEGSWSRPSIEARQKNVDISAELSDFYRVFRKFVLINSWHMNEYESMAMWKIYLAAAEGVAIQSTVQRLEESFASAQQDIHVGVVKYLDYQQEQMPTENLFAPFLHKQKSFEYECELRAVVNYFPTQDGNLELPDGDVRSFVPVDLDVLIERVIISPLAPPWFAELVQSIADRYEFDKPVELSALSRDPYF